MQMITTRHWSRALALGAMLAGASVPAARAADPPPAAADPAARFKELSARAEAAFQARQHQAAIDLYLEAYGVLPSPDVLYNIAYLYDRHLGKLELAQDFYRRVIREPNSSKEITELSMKRLGEIDAKLEARAKVLDGGPATSAPPTAPPTGAGGVVDRPAPPPDDGPGAAPWILIGTGTAAIVGGAVMALVASSTHDDYGRLAAATELDDKRATEDSGRSQALVADVLGIGGGVLVATGIIVYLAESSGARGAGSVSPLPGGGASLKPVLVPGGFGLALEGSL
ncbi:MAG: hypothetical protein IT385_30030 [Deltaproteobacteria bacterium]|nr:hypothetical protein [Deltaproteobacteria bacterium]